MRSNGRFPAWCPFPPCCGIFLQGAVKALAIINVGCDLLLGLLLSFRIVAITPYYWGSTKGQMKTWLIKEGRYVLTIFWCYTYIFLSFSIISSKFLYQITLKRDKVRLRNWLRMGIIMFILWVVFYIIEGVWHVRCGYYSPVTYLDVYTNVAIISFLVYKIYAFWVVGCFFLELRNYGSLNSALTELSDEDVEQFFKGHNSRQDQIFNMNDTVDCNDFASRPYKQDFEIALERLQLDENYPLGQGTFGTVFKANLIKADGTVEPVAVKTAQSSCDAICLRSLLTEVKILSYVGQNDNVVNLIGACTAGLKRKNIYVVVEFCPFGCVINYLRANRGLFVDTLIPKEVQDMSYCPYVTASGLPGPTTHDLIKWAMQTASGMQFISSKKVIHGDLAARNVLLTANLDVKIADFGLSRQLYKYSTYTKNSNEPLPWRWMAVESLTDLNFSTQSDVWAYGVTLWEYFTCGGTPYAESEYSQEFLWNLKSGQLQLPRPPYATYEMYEMMTKCWKIDPDRRPDFGEIKSFFQNLMQETLESGMQTSTNLVSRIPGYINYDDIRINCFG